MHEESLQPGCARGAGLTLGLELDGGEVKSHTSASRASFPYCDRCRRSLRDIPVSGSMGRCCVEPSAREQRAPASSVFGTISRAMPCSAAWPTGPPFAIAPANFCIASPAALLTMEARGLASVGGGPFELLRERNAAYLLRHSLGLHPQVLWHVRWHVRQLSEQSSMPSLVPPGVGRPFMETTTQQVVEETVSHREGSWGLAVEEYVQC